MNKFRVLVEVECSESDFLASQSSQNLPDKTVEQGQWELFMMYANSQAWNFWFIADYAAFPQIGWKISSPVDTYVVVKDILLFSSSQEQQSYCAVIMASWA